MRQFAAISGEQFFCQPQASSTTALLRNAAVPLLHPMHASDGEGMGECRFLVVSEAIPKIVS